MGDENNIMKNGECKECKRKERLYKEICFWCFIEKTREVALQLENEILKNPNLIEKERIKEIRNNLLEIV